MKARCTVCNLDYDSAATELVDFFGTAHGSVTICDQCYRARAAKRHTETLTPDDLTALQSDWRHEAKGE